MDVKIESRSGVRAFVCPAGQSILFAGLAAGLALPYDCATGTCGMCRARLLEGTIDVAWAGAPALARLQRDKGDILMCQAHPTSACTLRVPGLVRETDYSVPRRTDAIVSRAERLTGDVLALVVDLASPMTFAAGQFVVVSVPGLEGGRAYSMLNYVPDATTLELVVKKKPGGGLSEWLFPDGRPGTALSVFGPLGRATLKPKQDRDIVCIAGGSGIAGILSILEYGVACGHFEQHRGQVYFGVRTLADAFGLDRFARLIASADGHLDVVLALSHEVPAAEQLAAAPGVRLAHGLVHTVAEANLPPNCSAVTAFVAGPPPMVDAAIRTLLGRTVPSTSIRYDKFG